MSKKILHVKKLQNQRDWKRFNRYTPEQAIENLRAYLAGDIIIEKGFSQSSKKKPAITKAEFAFLNETQLLLLSVAVIGQRVILKYAKGETPHPDRTAVWKRGLEICGQFECSGILPPGQRVYIRKKELLFPGRLYNIAGIGRVIIPTEAPIELINMETVEYLTDNIDYRIGKKEAAKRILRASMEPRA